LIKFLTGGSVSSMRQACYPGLISCFPGVPSIHKVQNRPGFESSVYRLAGFKKFRV
jgi:hypothetical protein